MKLCNSSRSTFAQLLLLKYLKKKSDVPDLKTSKKELSSTKKNFVSTEKNRNSSKLKIVNSFSFKLIVRFTKIIKKN